MNAPTSLLSPYQYLKHVGRSIICQTWVAKDTRCEEDFFRIIQKFDFHTDDLSLIEFGHVLLSHKAQALQTLFIDIASIYRIHDFFCEGASFYLVQSMVKGQSLHRLTWQDSHEPPILSLLSDILMVLQQVYSWGLASCCLYPSDLIQSQSNNEWIWTGTGIFKMIVYQVCKPKITLTGFFPKDTAAYFAPEFLQGDFDIGTDLYTVGVAIIQALTQLPLKDLVYGNDGYFTIRRSWYRQTQLPEAIVEILSRMVNPNPMKRYATVTELSNDLDKLHP